MTVSTIATVWCDSGKGSGTGCFVWVAEVRDAKEARAKAKAEGWKRVDGKDLCPFCLENPEEGP